MTFGNTARSLIRHGFARGMEIAEGLDLLGQAHESNLVQFGENVRRQVNFICNCCGCCCEALIAALESINEDFGGYRVSFGPGNHVASKFVELSMLTGDGRVRT